MIPSAAYPASESARRLSMLHGKAMDVQATHCNKD